MPLINNVKYNNYFITSLLLHVVLLFLLIFNISFDNIEKPKEFNAAKNNNPQPEVIKATAVDNKTVEKEVARLNKIELDKKHAEQQRQKKLQEELELVKQQKLQEAKKLKEEQVKAEKLRQEQEILKKQQAEIAKNNQKIKEELAQKQAEKYKVEQQLKEKLAKKREEDLLAKLKAEQQEILQDSLKEEEELIATSRRQSSLAKREIDRYILMQQAKVSRSWISRESFLGRNLVTKLEIRLASDGRVISVNIVQSSGDAALDLSAKNAILKASPLPVPEDSSLRKNFTVYRFTFRPDELS